MSSIHSEGYNIEGNKRIQYLDLLRVVGSFAVVVSHVACQFSGVIVHLLIVFLAWSSIYAGIEMCKESNVGIEFFVSKIIFGHYHMWFLYMLMGLYLIIIIIEHRDVTTLFLGLGFIFNFVLPWIYIMSTE